MYGRATWWLTGIQVPFLALPLLPCVWPEMNCQIRLFQRGHLWAQVQFPCSNQHLTVRYSNLSSWPSVQCREMGTKEQFTSSILGWGELPQELRVTGLHLVAHSLDTKVKVSRTHSWPLHRISDTLDLSWAMLSDVEDHSSKDSTLVSSKPSCCSC